MYQVSQKKIYLDNPEYLEVLKVVWIEMFEDNLRARRTVETDYALSSHQLFQRQLNREREPLDDVETRAMNVFEVKMLKAMSYWMFLDNEDLIPK